MKNREIPDYFVYGEPVRDLDVGFTHVELVSTRNKLHRGTVAAHKHPQLAQITFWFKGRGTYHIEDQSWTFSAPAVSFVSSGVVHGFSITAQSDAIVLSISDDALKSIVGQGTAPVMFIQHADLTSDWADINTAMTHLLREYQERKPFAAQTMLHLSGLVFSLISRLDTASGKSHYTHVQTLAQRLSKLIDTHYRENWRTTHYIAALATTQHLLDKAAHVSFGKSIKQLILERRLLEAKRLLRFTIRSAEDIAIELGFKDPAYFSREFKKQTSVAPGMWRKSQRPT
jgi:AraC family transcriptional regulator, transcriptional activator of pobA